jgi:hypothetical protein
VLLLGNPLGKWSRQLEAVHKLHLIPVLKVLLKATATDADHVTETVGETTEADQGVVDDLPASIFSIS